MQIQTLSVVVPTKACVNRCAFCVSRMRNELYPNRLENEPALSSRHERDYVERMRFARDNGCNTVILTGEGEPLQNQHFLDRFAHFNDLLGDQRFRWIELQSSGFRLEDDTLTYLRDRVRVNTIALSVTDLFDDANNQRVVGMPEKYLIRIADVCEKVNTAQFNLRISLNLVSVYDAMSPGRIFARAKELGAHQLIFRVLYQSGEYGDIDRWIAENRASDETVGRMQDYIARHGNGLEKLPFGATRFSVDGISTVLDENCMPQETTTSFRYLILRPDCRLYSRWDDRGSLLF